MSDRKPSFSRFLGKAKKESVSNYKKGKQLYEQGDFQELIDFVDNIYGFKPGDLNRPPHVPIQEIARLCLEHLKYD